MCFHTVQLHFYMSQIKVVQNLYTQYPFCRKVTQIHINSCTADKLRVKVNYFMSFYQFLRISQNFVIRQQVLLWRFGMVSCTKDKKFKWPQSDHLLHAMQLPIPLSYEA